MLFNVFSSSLTHPNTSITRVAIEQTAGIAWHGSVQFLFFHAKIGKKSKQMPGLQSKSVFSQIIFDRKCFHKFRYSQPAKGPDNPPPPRRNNASHPRDHLFIELNTFSSSPTPHILCNNSSLHNLQTVRPNSTMAEYFTLYWLVLIRYFLDVKIARFEKSLSARSHFSNANLERLCVEPLFEPLK